MAYSARWATHLSWQRALAVVMVGEGVAARDEDEKHRADAQCGEL
jgi:hypothetical protein